ncbi:putative transcriptional regulator, MerR family [Parvibaculum lavamentivorans DS-1]|uniref:Putative transcriptional regulator, MerR family n=1 Tax=Parvibaculum lavamentivorans (strain DS-1 / DSM 13023 / NCIMB 13966) TaxID=402881 RepID=A7HP81_PARL1|nr:MerR family DNA-binding transcriptional regulator [Parvibaculum lavamentivorans]ABS61714.1 putative transcriptional regulator, MerR family [Parvibaculum lavamentivorans DS-1]
MAYTITDLATEFGITHRALRFYEEKGLIEPERQGQARLYSKRERARLQLILRGRDVGLTLYEIRQILDLYQSGSGCEEQYRLALSLFRKRLEAARQLRARVDAQIVELEEACQRLDSPKLMPSISRHKETRQLRTGTR